MAQKVFKPITSSKETIIPKQDFLNYILTSGNVVVKQGVAVGPAVTTLYTVPKTHTLFITSALIGYTTRTTASFVDVLFKFGEQLTGVNGFTIDPLDAANAQMYQNIAFPVPLKIGGGQVISCESQDANLKAVMWFFGYEVETSLIPNFI